MKRLLVAVFVLSMVSQAWAQKPAGKGWIALFDGKDLKGWKNNGQEKWVAEDGTILGESTVGHYGYLTTEKTFSNFELHVKFNPEKGKQRRLYPLAHYRQHARDRPGYRRHAGGS